MSANILIIDDHAIVRSGIKAIIKSSIPAERIDDTSTEDNMAALMKLNTYDLILLDINIPGSDFINLMHWLKATAPQSAILIFSMYDEEMYGKRCLQLGAKGFLHKTAPDDEIVYALKKVLAGGIYINATLEKILAEPTKETANPFDNLSTRELEIARLINQGHKLPEICSLLNIQYSTANTYKRRILEKLNVKSVVGLLRLMDAFKMAG